MPGVFCPDFGSPLPPILKLCGPQASPVSNLAIAPSLAPVQEASSDKPVSSKRKLLEKQFFCLEGALILWRAMRPRQYPQQQRAQTQLQKWQNSCPTAPTFPVWVLSNPARNCQSVSDHI